jgi:hypothetical protein
MEKKSNKWKIVVGGVGILIGVIGTLLYLFGIEEKGKEKTSPVPVKTARKEINLSTLPLGELEKGCNRGKGNYCTEIGERNQREKGVESRLKAYNYYFRGCQLGDKQGCKKEKKMEGELAQQGKEVGSLLVKLEEKVRKSPKFPEDLKKFIEKNLQTSPVPIKIWEEEGGYILGVADWNGSFTPCVRIDITEITIVYATLPNGFKNPICKWVGIQLGKGEE